MTLTPPDSPRPVYVLRDDSTFACPDLNPSFVPELAGAIERHSGVHTITIDVLRQIHQAREYIARAYPDCLILSADRWFRGDHDIDISRAFRADDAQAASHDFIIDPESAIATLDWLSKSRGRPIIFLDDDVATGSTMNHIEELFGIEFQGYFSLADFSVGFWKIHDIVDVRDFVPGAIHGGLLIYDSSRSTPYRRELYLHPTVNLIERMKLPDEKACRRFTLDVMNLQRKYIK